MKKRVFFLLLFSIIFIGMCNEVNALEKIATCSYSVKDVQDFEIEIYNNKIEHPDNDLVPGKSIMFMYSFKEKEYLNKVYDGNKLAAQCPTLAYCTDASGNYIIQAENTICAAGGDSSTSIFGTMKIEKNDIEVKEDKSRTVCTRYSTPRGGKKLEIKFGYNADGEKNFSVYWEGTTTGASALYDASIVVSDVIYSVDEELYDVFWDDDSCESSDLYFENQGAETSGTKHYIITNKKSSGLNNGSNDNSTGHEDKTPSSSASNKPFNPKQLCEESENCDISLANFCTTPTVARTFKFLGLLFYIAKILVPGIIIVMGFVNLFKIMTSGKLDDAKKYAKSIIIRIFVGIAIFLLPGIINTIYDAAKGIIGSGGTGGFDNCASCLLNPNSDKCYIEEN